MTAEVWFQRRLTRADPDCFLSTGAGLAMALAFGAQAVWVGTRFICAKEAGAPPRHQVGRLLPHARVHDTLACCAASGDWSRLLGHHSHRDLYRPTDAHPEESLRDALVHKLRKNARCAMLPRARREENRQDEIKELCDNGIVPYTTDLEDKPGSDGKSKLDDIPPITAATFRPLLMGQAAGTKRNARARLVVSAQRQAAQRASTTSSRPSRLSTRFGSLARARASHRL